MREIKARMDNEGVLHYDPNGDVIVTIKDDPNTRTCSINVGNMVLGYGRYETDYTKLTGVISSQLEYNPVIMKSLENLICVM